MDGVSYVILAVATLAIAWVLTVVFRKGCQLENVDQEIESSAKAVLNGDSKAKKVCQTGESKKGSSKPGKVKATQQQSKEKFSHLWLVSTLRGHSGKVLGIDLSPNNKFLASCADDRTVYLWFTKDFADRDHKSIRVNIPFDHANFVRWSPDSKAFVISRYEEKMLEVYKLGRKSDNSIGNITSALQWPQSASVPIEYIGVGIACNGKFVMSCTVDGCVTLREPKGSVLKTLFSPVTPLVEAKVSHCGRYVAVAGKEEVIIYEVLFGSSQFQDASLKWKLKVGGSASIASIDFNTDSSKIVVMCRNGKWHLYDTTGSRVNVETDGKIEDDMDDSSTPVVALSGDSRVVLVGAQSNIYLFSAFSGDLLDKIYGVHKGDVSNVAFSADCKYFLTAGDSVIHVFNNEPWYKETIKILKSQISDASTAGPLRGRLVSELSSVEQEAKNKGFTSSL